MKKGRYSEEQIVRILREADRDSVGDVARNLVWCCDFVFDACANGQQLKCLTLADEYTRECLAIDVAGSIRSRRVIDILSRLISVHGAPRYIRSDNGPEFVSTALMKGALEQQIETAFIDPWQAMAKRHQRKLQRQVPGRVPGDGMVSQPDRGQDRQ